LNEGLNNNAVAPESRLIIPIAPGKQADTSTYAHATMRYKIRKGDTVDTVAENFGVSAKMVRSWNHLKGTSLAGRKVLYLHLPVTRTTTRTRTTTAGESQVASSSKSKPCRDGACPVSAASRAHHTSGTQAAGTQPGTHQAGTQTATVKGTSSKSSTRSSNAAPDPTVKHHKVKPGETLYSIATSYNTSVSALKHDNRNIAALRPGMILIVHESR
jgi:LysM repeat protein